MFRIAYRLPALPRMVKESPEFRRLRQQIPDGADGVWSAQEHPDGGSLLIWPGEASRAFSLADFGPGRPTHDGLTHYPSLVPLDDLTTILKPEIARPRDGEWVTLESGADLWVAVATMAERRWVLLAGGGQRQAPTKQRYGVLARELMGAAKRTPPASDEEISGITTQLVIAAIQTSYLATDEMLEDVEFFYLTDVDIGMIQGVALGLSPKESAAALTASLCASLAAESPTSL